MGVNIVGDFNPISAGIGAVQGVANGIFGLVGQKKSYKYNSALQQQASQLENQNWFQQYERQFNDQLKWREDEREYNSPEAQMSRLKAAGINPTFGNGGISAGNYSLNPEMPGTAANVGSPGVGNVSQSLGDFLNAGFDLPLRERGMRVKEKEVGIKENLSEAQIGESIAKIESMLTGADLSRAQIDKINEEIPSIKQSVLQSAAETQKILSDKVVNMLNAYANMRFQEWEKEHWERMDASGFIEANAAASNAQTRKGELAELKRWHDEQKRQFDESLEKQYTEMLHRFEKDGIDAIVDAIDRSSIGIKGVGKWTDKDDLKEQIALLAAASTYIQNFDIDAVLLSANDGQKHDSQKYYNAFMKLLKKYTNFVGSFRMLPEKHYDIDESTYGAFPEN